MGAPRTRSGRHYTGGEQARDLLLAVAFVGSYSFAGRERGAGAARCVCGARGGGLGKRQSRTTPLVQTCQTRRASHGARLFCVHRRRARARQFWRGAMGSLVVLALRQARCALRASSVPRCLLSIPSSSRHSLRTPGTCPIRKTASKSSRARTLKRLKRGPP
jgi:hypothetical protein